MIVVQHIFFKDVCDLKKFCKHLVANVYNIQPGNGQREVDRTVILLEILIF